MRTAQQEAYIERLRELDKDGQLQDHLNRAKRVVAQRIFAEHPNEDINRIARVAEALIETIAMGMPE